MTSSDNVENKQDKRSASDNVHYVQWPGGNCDDDGVVFDVRCPVHSNPSLLAKWRAMFCHASAQSPANQSDERLLEIAKDAERQAFGHIEQMTCTGAIYNALKRERDRRNPPNPHASPSSTPQVNHTPANGIQDDDC